MKVCGSSISSAEDISGSGPFYIDTSTNPPAAPVVAVAGSNPMNVQVSPDSPKER
jgi:hypothetical protein